MYRHGEQAALIVLGIKTAADAEDSDILTGQNAAVGAAALSPFAGMIGQKPIIHDPHISNAAQKFESLAALSRDARTNDIIVSGKPTYSMWKNTMTPLTGTEFYHAQPVIGRRNGHGVSASAGDVDPEYAKKSLKDLVAGSPQVTDMAKDYADYVLLRPKNVTAPQSRELLRHTGTRLPREYDTMNALKAWAYDVFVPKIPGAENLKGSTICEGNICSTLPAQALKDAIGKDVIPGKPAKYVLPADFLRSDQYDLVGAYSPNLGPGRLARKIQPYLSRAALGSGMAAGAYALTEDPTLAAIPAGAVAGHHLGSRLYAGQKLPEFTDLIYALTNLDGGHTPKQVSDITRKYTKAKLLPQLAGATLAYGGAQGLQHLLRSKKEQ